MGRRAFLAASLVSLVFGGALWSAPSPTRPARSALSPSAQQPQPSGSQQTFRTGTEIVTVTATVTDRTGQAVTSLKKEDFRIFEEGAAQDIALFSLDTNAPISVALAIDVSGSMEDKLDDVEDAVNHFVRQLKAEDEVGVLTFNQRVEFVVSVAGGDRDRIPRALGQFRAGGGTALYDAVGEAVKGVSEGRHRKKVVIAITDGNDTASDTDRGSVEHIIRRSEVLVYALGIGHGSRGSFGHGWFGHPDRVDGSTLKRLAEPSGGRSWVLEGAHRGSVDLIDQAVNEIAAELRTQYTLGYYPPPGGRAGEFRRLRVETTNTAYKVRSRTGYWVPEERER